MGGLWQANGRAALVMLTVATRRVRHNARARPLAQCRARRRNVGARSRRERPASPIHVLLLIGVTASAAVSLSGVIGFIGLIVPHCCDSPWAATIDGLVPATALGGALLLLLADTLARTLAAPAEIPVGILTALPRRTGVPLLLRRR